jgi:hypothetical protein
MVASDSAECRGLFYRRNKGVVLQGGIRHFVIVKSLRLVALVAFVGPVEICAVRVVQQEALSSMLLNWRLRKLDVTRALQFFPPLIPRILHKHEEFVLQMLVAGQDIVLALLDLRSCRLALLFLALLQLVRGRRP